MKTTKFQIFFLILLLFISFLAIGRDAPPIIFIGWLIAAVIFEIKGKGESEINFNGVRFEYMENDNPDEILLEEIKVINNQEDKFNTLEKTEFRKTLEGY